MNRRGFFSSLAQLAGAAALSTVPMPSLASQIHRLPGCFTPVNFKAKKLVCLVNVPNELFQFTSPATEAVLREDLWASCRRIDANILASIGIKELR